VDKNAATGSYFTISSTDETDLKGTDGTEFVGATTQIMVA